MNVDLVRKLELTQHDGDDDGHVFNVDAAFDVSAMTFGQRMTRNLLDGKPVTKIDLKFKGNYLSI